MKRRLMAGETEIGLTSSRYEYIDGDEIAKMLPDFMREHPLTLDDFDESFLERCANRHEFKEENLNFVSGFLQGGDRFYYDCHHAEISWRECNSVFDIAAVDHAATRIMDAAVRKFQRKNPQYGQLTAFKDSVAAHAERGVATWGAHENYLIERESWDRRRFLIPFLVTRQIFTGQGGFKTDIIDKNKDSQFENYFILSERAAHIKAVESKETTSNRPIINLKDEPHINPEYRRLHLILGDPNICAYTTALKFGTTHLVLRLLEEDPGFHMPLLRDPVSAMHSISLHPQSRIELSRIGLFGYELFRYEERKTAPEIQRGYLDVAKRRFAGENDETDWILENWEYVLDEIEKEDGIPGNLVGLIDRFTKEEILRKVSEELGLDLSKEDDRFHLRSYDKAYENINMREGLPWLYPGNQIYFPSTPDKVLERVFRPSYSTRSSLRSFPITFYPEEIQEVDWSYVSFKNETDSLDLHNTTFTDYRTVEKLFAAPPPLKTFLEIFRNGKNSD